MTATDDAPPTAEEQYLTAAHTTIALCWACHQGPSGWHGDKALWRVRKFDELKALDVTLARLGP